MTPRTAPWFELSKGRLLTMAPQRRHRGKIWPARYLVLGPARNPDRLRPTLVVGDFVDDRCTVEHGLLDEAFRAELETACREALVQFARGLL